MLNSKPFFYFNSPYKYIVNIYIYSSTCILPQKHIDQPIIFPFLFVFSSPFFTISVSVFISVFLSLYLSLPFSMSNPNGSPSKRIKSLKRKTHSKDRFYYISFGYLHFLQFICFYKSNWFAIERTISAFIVNFHMSVECGVYGIIYLLLVGECVCYRKSVLLLLSQLKENFSYE